MTTDRDVGRLLDLWLADGIDEVNDRVLDVVEGRIGAQRQRPGWRVSWRDASMNGTFKLAAGLAAAVLVAVGAWQLLPAPGGSGGQPTTAPTAPPAGTTAPATPGQTPATSSLTGTWVSAPSTCADQNAALDRAGFTTAQLQLAGWVAATCRQEIFSGPQASGPTHGNVQEVRFDPTKRSGLPATADGRLLQLADGKIGWDGYYQVIDGDTIVAGDGGREPYVTYAYSVDGDQLVVDMVTLEAWEVGVTEEQLWADRVAQTVIYETEPFTRTE